MSASLLVLIGVAAAGATGPKPFHVFGEADRWIITDDDGAVVERLESFGGMRTVHAAITADGAEIVFTSRNDAAQNDLLYLWDRGARPPRLLGSKMGFHANPSFTRDEEWVVFAHHPRKGGPPGQHEPGANAQVYRVRRDGTRLEALTNTPGCKVSPVSPDGFALFFIHSTCDLMDGVSFATAGGAETRLGQIDAKYKALQFSPDADQLALVELRIDTFAVWILNRKTQIKRPLLEAPKRTLTPQLAWSQRGRHLLLYNGSVQAIAMNGAVRETATLEVTP
ncbi:MAG: hypothetical protein JNK82_10070 [Myxococcaceae bacterium]|nr:hypothetical protein [Myxococcaceae bacterium]